MHLFNKVDIHYYFDTVNEFSTIHALAYKDYDRLVAEGYPSVEIIISHHPYSEGLWVEAGKMPRDKSVRDQVLKTNQKNNYHDKSRIHMR